MVPLITTSVLSEDIHTPLSLEKMKEIARRFGGYLIEKYIYY
jgi:hypothetical protein